MAVTDLTNTTWVINATPSPVSETLYFNLNFTSNSETYTALTIYDAKDADNNIAYRGASEFPNIVFDRTSWKAEAYRTVAISGGTDATNSTLISWFETNAVQQTVTTPDISITYEDTEIATMSESGTKTLKTSGKYCTDDITIEYTKQGSTPNLQAKTNIAPTTSSQTITADSGYDGLSSVQINAMPSGSAGTPTATKSAVSNHSVSVTPSVTNTTGYITGSTKTGTAVTVSASELVSGSQTITQNGTVDVTNLASVTVNVSGGGGGWQDISNSISFDNTVTVVYAISNGSYAFFDVIADYAETGSELVTMTLPQGVYFDTSYEIYDHMDIGFGVEIAERALLETVMVEIGASHQAVLTNNAQAEMEYVYGASLTT